MVGPPDEDFGVQMVPKFPEEASGINPPDFWARDDGLWVEELSLTVKRRLKF